jgi:hypothetical protein
MWLGTSIPALWLWVVLAAVHRYGTTFGIIEGRRLAAPWSKLATPCVKLGNGDVGSMVGSCGKQVFRREPARPSLNHPVRHPLRNRLASISFSRITMGTLSPELANLVARWWGLRWLGRFPAVAVQEVVDTRAMLDPVVGGHPAVRS